MEEPEALLDESVSMSGFCEEITRLKEMEESGDANTSHFTRSDSLPDRFPGVDISKLTHDDAVMWHKIKNYSKFSGGVDADWKKYVGLVQSSGDSSRRQFKDFLSNKKSLESLKNFRSRK